MMHKIKIIFSWLLIGVLFLGALEPGSDAFAAKKNKYIRMNVKSVTLSKNGMYKLRLYNTKKRQTIVFSSDNESIATVTSTTQPEPGKYLRSCDDFQFPWTSCAHFKSKGKSDAVCRQCQIWEEKNLPKRN